MASEAKPTFDPLAPIDPSRALVPATVRVNEMRVQKGFWPKVRRVAAKIPFAKQLLSVWFSARDEETPLRVKGMMLAALAYFVLPADALPDVLTGIGYTDDAAVLFALLNLVGSHVKPKHKQAASDTLDRFRRD
jgi:uncharacterized membrane protein YkvA (DUF1232 family)